MFNQYYKDVSHARIESIQNSEIYGKNITGYCRYDGECDEFTSICHRTTVPWLKTKL